MTSLIEISTEGHAPKDRLEVWSDAVLTNIGGLRSESFGEPAFNGRIVATMAGYLRLVRIEASSHRVVRTPDLARRANDGYLKIVAQLHGRACFQQGGREVWLAPGEWSVYDTTRAYTVTNPVSVDQLIVMIPKDRLPEALPYESLVVHHLSGRTGVGRLTWDAMLSLYQELPSMSRQAADGMADVLTELVHLSLLDLQGKTTHLTQREALRDRITGYISRHLCDSRLSVEAIAVALNCSRRHLYNAFPKDQGGIAGYILKERLAMARRALDDPLNAARTLTDVAYECGFSRPSHLTQVFRTQLGITPGEYRHQKSQSLIAALDPS